MKCDHALFHEDYEAVDGSSLREVELDRPLAAVVRQTIRDFSVHLPLAAIADFVACIILPIGSPANG